MLECIEAIGRQHVLHDDIHVWFTRTGRDDGSARIAACQALLSDVELERAGRFHYEKDRSCFIVSHALVRKTLSCYADVLPEAWEFENGMYGRPRIAEPKRYRSLCFNLSHTDGAAAVVVSGRLSHPTVSGEQWQAHCEVGIDIEALTRRPVDFDVATRYLSRQEIEHLLAEREEHRHELFLELWTLKESYAKARGMGLSVPFDGFSLHRQASESPTISFAPSLPDQPAMWQFVQLRPTTEHVIGVAARRRQPGHDRPVRLFHAMPGPGASEPTVP